MIPTPLTNNRRSKRQQIWELVSEGKLTPAEIAVRIGTSVENVWKETSRLRSQGGYVMSRRTTKRSDKREMILVEGEQRNENNIGLQRARPSVRSASIPLTDYLSSITQLDSGGLKVLYKEFKAAKKPVDIIAEHGFHPDIVELEYRRFMRLSERDSDQLLNRIVQDIVQGSYSSESIKSLINLYHQRGYLMNDEILDLLKQYIQEKLEEEIAMFTIDRKLKLPTGFRRLRCRNCKEELFDAIISDKLPLGKELIDRYDGRILCELCRHSSIVDPETQ